MKIFSFILFFFSFRVFALEDTFVEKSLDKIDDAQEYIEDSWKEVNYSIDSFFSNKRYSPLANESKISLYWLAGKTEGEKFENQYDIALKMKIPEISKRLKLTFEKEKDEILLATTSPAKRATIAQKKGKEKNQYSLTTDFSFLENPYYKTDLSLGLRFDMPLNPSAKFSIFNEGRIRKFTFSGEQKFILYRQEGFSEFTSAYWGYSFSRKLNLSQNNVLSWEDQTDLLSLRNDISLGQALWWEAGLTYSLGANAQFVPHFHYVSYDASISYKKVLFSDWFLGSITVGTEFLKENNFHPKNFIQVRFDID